MRSWYVLDVGCGNHPHGTVNCDIYRYHNPQIQQQNKVPVEVKRNIRNFIVCSGEYLCFKDKSFDVVYSSHVIEHCVDPVRFLKELIRVARDTVIIVVPHRFSKWAKERLHKHFFNVAWFGNTLRNYTFTIKSKPKSWLPFIPEEMEVQIILRGIK